MSFNLVIVLMHAPFSALRLFNMTETHATGSKTIVESVQRVVNNPFWTGNVLRNLFTVLDTCSRKDKNHFMAYIGILVRWYVFGEVDVILLPAGHTHSDVDQTFSATSCHLRTHEAVILIDMDIELAKCYNDQQIVTSGNA